MGGSTVAIIGYTMLMVTRTPAIQYGGSIVVAAGLFPSVATVVAWTGGNVAGEVKRAVAIGFVIGFGNLAG